MPIPSSSARPPWSTRGSGSSRYPIPRQGLRRGLAPRHPRAHARDQPSRTPPASMGAEKNPPIFVYDTSGPYTDPAVHIDIRAGLPSVRGNWIEGPRRHGSAGPAHFRIRAATPGRPQARRIALQPAARPAPRQSRMNVSQMYYARRRHRHAGDGIRRHPREPAPRQSGGNLHPPASWRELRRRHSRRDHARIRTLRNCRAAPSSPPTFNHPSWSPVIIGRNFLVKINGNIRQFRGQFIHRRRSGENDLGIRWGADTIMTCPPARTSTRHVNGYCAIARCHRCSTVRERSTQALGKSRRQGRRADLEICPRHH